MVLDTKNRMEVTPMAIEDDVLHLQHQGDNGLQSRRGWPPLMGWGWPPLMGWEWPPLMG